MQRRNSRLNQWNIQREKSFLVVLTGIVIIVFTWNRYNFLSTWTSDINGPGTAVVLLPHIKLDRLALKQHTESIALDVRVVYEDVTAVSLCVVWKNKTKFCFDANFSKI